MVYVDFEDAAVLELFRFAEDALDGDGVAVGFCVDDVCGLAFAVEEYVEFAHGGFLRFEGE